MHSLSRQNQLYQASCLAAVSLFIGGIVAVRTGHEQLLLPGMVVLSPVATLLLRWLYEDRLEWSFFNPMVTSWKFVLGDAVMLPITLLLAASGWQELPAGWYQSSWFAVMCGMIGLTVAVGLRRLDSRRYIDADVPSALISPTKVWHDLVVMPVAVGLLSWLLIPQFFGASGFTRPAFVFLGMFGCAVLLDAITKPDPAGQHPQWDPIRFEAA